MSFRQREREREVLNRSAKERFTTDVIRKRSLETSVDTYVDFHTANAVKHGMDSFSVRSDFGSLQSTFSSMLVDKKGQSFSIHQFQEINVFEFNDRFRSSIVHHAR